ncbi:MAG TPA: cupredoxin domain-containing protein [Anaerolineales bacterium]
MKRTISIVLIAFVFSLALASCGEESSNSIRVVMTDFAFSPNTFTVTAGQPISVELVNNGAATHSFVIMQAGYQVQGHFTDADRTHVLWQVSAVAPGQSMTQTFTAPSDPGEYQVVCANPAHFESGMVAKLVVVKAP